MSRWYVLLLLLLLLLLLPLASSPSPFPPFRLSSIPPSLLPSFLSSAPFDTQNRDEIDTDNKLFFDDEHRNFEVESLGVTMCLVEPRGTDLKLFKEGLGMWRKRRGLKVEQE
jgi:hypothetical protein